MIKQYPFKASALTVSAKKIATTLEKKHVQKKYKTDCLVYAVGAQPGQGKVESS